MEGNYYISKIQEEQLLVCQYYLYIERESEFLKYLKILIFLNIKRYSKGRENMIRIFHRFHDRESNIYDSKNQKLDDIKYFRYKY